MRMELDLDFDLKITVEVEISKGTNAKFSGSFGNYLPGEPSEIEIKRVMIGNHQTPLDITKHLTQKDLSIIRKACWDSIEDDAAGL